MSSRRPTPAQMRALADFPSETVERIKARKYECFIEDHEPRSWTPGRCAGYAGRGVHLMRCKRKDGHGLGALFCAQHAKTGGF